MNMAKNKFESNLSSYTFLLKGSVNAHLGSLKAIFASFVNKVVVILNMVLSGYAFGFILSYSDLRSHTKFS